jgi:hypothetical protein
MSGNEEISPNLTCFASRPDVRVKHGSTGHTRHSGLIANER